MGHSTTTIYGLCCFSCDIGRSSAGPVGPNVAQPRSLSDVSKTSQDGVEDQKQESQAPQQDPGVDEGHAPSDKSSAKADEPGIVNSPATEWEEKTGIVEPSRAADGGESDVVVSVSEELDEEEGAEDGGDKEDGDSTLVLNQKTSEPLSQDVTDREDEKGEASQEAPTEQSVDKDKDQHGNGSSQQPDHLKQGSSSSQAEAGQKKQEHPPAIAAAASQEGVLAPTASAVYGASAPKPPQGYEVRLTLCMHLM